jgi:hypothetical protein
MLGLACRTGIRLFARSTVGFVGDRHSLILSLGPSYVAGSYKTESACLAAFAQRQDRLQPQVIASRLPLMLLIFSRFESCLGSIGSSGYCGARWRIANRSKNSVGCWLKGGNNLLRELCFTGKSGISFNVDDSPLTCLTSTASSCLLNSSTTDAIPDLVTT